MILTTKGRYAVMAIIDLAESNQFISVDKQKPINLFSISERQKISLSYLEQIFSKLKKSGIVGSVKGPGGGYILNKDPRKITIAEITSAMGERMKMTRCSSDKKSCIDGNKVKCRTHHIWQGLEQKIVSYLDSISLQDICGNKQKYDEQHHLSR